MEKLSVTEDGQSIKYGGLAPFVHTDEAQGSISKLQLGLGLFAGAL